MIIPVSIKNELTQKGASKVILGMLSLFGIIQLSNRESLDANHNIQETNNETIDDDTSKITCNGIKLVNGYHKRTLLNVGDRLSQARLMALRDY